MRAVNNSVIIKRHPRVEGMRGLVVSERAHADHYAGIVISSAYEGIKEGDEVLIPVVFRDVDDCVVVKGADIVAKKEGNWKPLGKRVLVRKCITDHIRDETGNVLLYMPDIVKETTPFVEILDIGCDCVFMRPEHKGRFTDAPEFSDKLNRIGYTEDFILDEAYIRFTIGEENGSSNQS